MANPGEYDAAYKDRSERSDVCECQHLSAASKLRGGDGSEARNAMPDREDKCIEEDCSRGRLCFEKQPVAKHQLLDDRRQERDVHQYIAHHSADGHVRYWPIVNVAHEEWVDEEDDRGGRER